jgi:hypothetical protein
MQEGTTSRVRVADRPYGEFLWFYSISLEYFGYHLILKFLIISSIWDMGCHVYFQLIIGPQNNKYKGSLWALTFYNTVELHLSEFWLSGSPIIWIGLALG